MEIQDKNIYSNGLSIYIGPKYSGKSNKIIELYKLYNQTKLNICVINYTDIKTETYFKNKLYTNDNYNIECIYVNQLYNYSGDFYQYLNDEFNYIDVFLIDNGHLYSDIFHWINEVLKYNKIIHLTMLNDKTDNNCLELINICDHLYKLNSLCNICKINYSIYNYTISIKDKKTKCIPLCRKCFSFRKEIMIEHIN